MKQKNVYSQNERYFTTSEWMKILGAALVILAVAIFFWGRGYVAYLLMCAAAPVGVVLFFVAGSRRANDADLDRFIELATEGIEVALEEDRVYAKRLDKSFAPIYVGGYIYEGDVLLAKAKNGMIRSTAYEKSVLYTLTDALYISARRISLISDKQENTTYEIPFAELEKMEILAKDHILVCENKDYHVKETNLLICKTDGSAISLPIKDDLVLEEFIERILRNVKKQKANNE